MSKGFKSYFPVWAILMVLFNVIAWVVPVDHDKTFFAAYGFTMGAMVIQLVISLAVMSSEEKALKYPIVIFSICGVAFVALVNVLCVWLKGKIWVIVVVNSIILAFNYLTLITQKEVERK